MKHLYPSYYEKFRCIAAACPDSCCQGWDVVIDEKTEAFYNSVKGDFGDKLRNAIYTDPDGDRVFRLADEKKCPFWGDDKLCDIYRTLGEEHLCLTCAMFPRITMNYTTFAEHTLALACPEAARLILAGDHAYTRFDATEFVPCDAYDAEIMSFLLQTRGEAARILASDQPLEQRLRDLLDFADRAQSALTGESSAFYAPDLTEIYSDLEYIDEDSRTLIVNAVESTPDLSAHERKLTNLSLYYLYRYYLGAVDSLDVLAPVRFAVCSVRVIAALSQQREITDAAQLYSKEIEQSYENMERLTEALGL